MIENFQFSQIFFNEHILLFCNKKTNISKRIKSYTLEGAPSLDSQIPFKYSKQLKSIGLVIGVLTFMTDSI